jgi:hypothetical protein
LLSRKAEPIRCVANKRRPNMTSYEFRARAQAASPLGSTSGEGSKLRTSQGSALRRFSVASHENGQSSSESLIDDRSMRKASLRASFDVEAVEIGKNGTLKAQPRFSKTSRKFGSGLAPNQHGHPNTAMNQRLASKGSARGSLQLSKATTPTNLKDQRQKGTRICRTRKINSKANSRRSNVYDSIEDILDQKFAIRQSSVNSDLNQLKLQTARSAVRLGPGPKA